MRPHRRHVVLVLTVTLPALALAAAIGHAGVKTASRSKTKTSSATLAPRSKSISHTWHIANGPDPFALPRHDPRKRPQVPFRMSHDTDTLPIEDSWGSPVPSKQEKPPIVAEQSDNSVRMAGFLCGNGVYAVLSTAEKTMVVNPGDRLDDNRVVSDIRPNEMHLADGNMKYRVPLRP